MVWWGTSYGRSPITGGWRPGEREVLFTALGVPFRIIAWTVGLANFTALLGNKLATVLVAIMEGGARESMLARATMGPIWATSSQCAFWVWPTIHASNTEPLPGKMLDEKTKQGQFSDGGSKWAKRQAEEWPNWSILFSSENIHSFAYGNSLKILKKLHFIVNFTISSQN